MQELQELDASNMKQLVEQFPLMLRLPRVSNTIIDYLEAIREEGYAGVLLAGMGGSSISGAVCKGLLTSASKPIILHQDYGLPSFVDCRWIVIGTSYSGNTVETLSACKEAIRRKCPTIAVTSGGALEKMIQEEHMQSIPGGFPPRAAFPLITAVLLPILEKIMQLPCSNLTNIARNLERLRNGWRSISTTPRELAQKMLGKIPLFIGWRHLSPVAYRAKCQMNENAKSIAYAVEIPEANHNEIEASESYRGHSILPVFLRSASEEEEVSKRFEATSRILGEQKSKALEIKTDAKEPTEEALSLIYFLDFASIELAELRGVDPLQVDKIARLKAILNS